MAETINGKQFAPGDEVRISGSNHTHKVVAVRTERFPQGGLQQIVMTDHLDRSANRYWMRAAHFEAVRTQA